jgi:hypothetical protein
MSSESTPKKSFTRFFPPIARYLLGVPLVIFGLNCFLNFIPQPKMALPEGAVAFTKALMDTGYMMKLIGATQVVSGLMLVTNLFVPLALALFAPFIVNAVAFHLVLERSGLAPAGVFLALELYLAWAYRKSYCSMLAMKTKLD